MRVQECEVGTFKGLCLNSYAGSLKTASSASAFLNTLKWSKYRFCYCAILLKVSPSFTEDRFTPGRQTNLFVLYKQVCFYSVDRFPSSASSPTDCNEITCLMISGWKESALTSTEY